VASPFLFRGPLVAAALALVVAGCGGTRQASSPRSSTSKPKALPTPFAVVGRYSAKSLGLKDLRGLAILRLRKILSGV